MNVNNISELINEITMQYQLTPEEIQEITTKYQNDTRDINVIRKELTKIGSFYQCQHKKNAIINSTADLVPGKNYYVTAFDDNGHLYLQPVSVTVTNPDATAQKLTSPYTFTVSALGKYTLKVVVEDIYGNVETITKEITVTAVETERPGTDEPANKGCGGSIVASIFGVLALAGTVVVLRKKREE